MNAIIDITIEDAPRSDFDIAEEIAKSLLRDPDGWEFYSSGYDSKRKQLEVSLYMGELHSEDAW